MTLDQAAFRLGVRGGIFVGALFACIWDAFGMPLIWLAAFFALVLVTLTLWDSWRIEL